MLSLHPVASPENKTLPRARSLSQVLLLKQITASSLPRFNPTTQGQPVASKPQRRCPRAQERKRGETRAGGGQREATSTPSTARLVGDAGPAPLHLQSPGSTAGLEAGRGGQTSPSFCKDFFFFLFLPFNILPRKARKKQR